MKKFFIFFLFLCFIINLFIFIEQYASKDIFFITYSDKYKKYIQNSNPDLILIGNSLLNPNINKYFLNKELSRLYGCKIKVIFIASGGAQSAWYYLILKNQILTSNIKNIPVGFVFWGDDITNPILGTQDGSLYQHEIKKTFLPEDLLFLKKIKKNAKFYKKRKLNLLENRYEIKRFILDNYGNNILKLTNINQNLKKKFYNKTAPKYQKSKFKKVLDDVFNNKYFKSFNIKKRLYCSQNLTKESFENLVKESFLIDILNYKDNYKIFFIQSHPKKNFGTCNNYLTFLENYLKEKKSFLINLRNRSELDDMNLYRDDMHFYSTEEAKKLNKKNGIKLNTKILADEIYKRKIIK